MPKCRICGVELTPQNWYPSYIKKNAHCCKECLKTSDRDYKRKNRKLRKKWSDGSRERLLQDVVAHYRGKCHCCGEKDWRFLTLSHPNNDGKKQRMELGGQNQAGNHFYRWLRKNNYPTNYEIVVECFNCNMARQRNNGVCPHVTEKMLEL